MNFGILFHHMDIFFRLVVIVMFCPWILREFLSPCSEKKNKQKQKKKQKKIAIK